MLSSGSSSGGRGPDVAGFDAGAGLLAGAGWAAGAVSVLTLAAPRWDTACEACLHGVPWVQQHWGAVRGKVLENSNGLLGRGVSVMKSGMSLVLVLGCFGKNSCEATHQSVVADGGVPQMPLNMRLNQHKWAY